MLFLMQIPTCFLFISTFFLGFLGKDVGVSSYLKRNQIQRTRRQGPIVQPSWAINPNLNLFEDYDVTVTEEKLEETEAIRDYIQETVDNGTYVVELDEGDFEEDELKGDEGTSSVDLSQPTPELKIKPKTTTISTPKPKQRSSNIKQKPEPRKEQSEGLQPSLFNLYRTIPKKYSSTTGNPFFIWLRKRFNR